jgi:polyphosphate kinase 2 (PPK2 family)
MSKEEQRRRFLARIAEPSKNWKFSMGDVEERGHWEAYMRAYELALSATSTRESPWYVVPADDKPNARLIVSRVVNATLEALQLQFPKLDRKKMGELEQARRQLMAENK